MMDRTISMRKVAEELLGSGKVDIVIGWEKGRFWWQSPPLFIEEVKDVERLVWDPFCFSNLSKYLLDFKGSQKRVGIFVKGCDSRGINRLLQDKQIAREKVFLIGVPCDGMVDPQKAMIMEGRGERLSREGEEFIFLNSGKKIPANDLLMEKCLLCEYPDPLVYDMLLPVEDGEAGLMEGASGVKEGRGGAHKVHLGEGERYTRVLELDELSPDEKYDFWKSYFERCIRCYACRNVCPACNCRECIFDMEKTGWLGKARVLSETELYQVIRAFHVAGRCIECGECERVCPVDIPLMLINRKIIKEINELFGEYDAGVDLSKGSPLGEFKLSDPEEFM